MRANGPSQQRLFRPEDPRPRRRSPRRHLLSTLRPRRKQREEESPRSLKRKTKSERSLGVAGTALFSERLGNGTVSCGTGDLGGKLPGNTSYREAPDQSENSGYELDRDPEGMCFKGETLDSPFSFRRLVAVAPRLILTSRTRLSTALEKSFRIISNGDPPCTTVFPLPLEDFGISSQRISPRLSVNKWWKPCRKRLLHIFIVFLNYLYHEGAAFDHYSLGRRPIVQHRCKYIDIWTLSSP